ncbi:MAG TPA: Slp family lipoprotein [Xanthomonadales bacterium]|nr:Slp family lipoprotein [Xanthomonadales bacterium]
MSVRALALAALASLAGCTTTPPIDATNARLDWSPIDAAQAPRSAGQEVVWGGMIVAVENLRDASEVEVLAYPLDAKQRPLLKQPTMGRFIAVLPGYVERFDFPEGRFVTLRGSVSGTREALIDERPYLYPVVATETVHLWPENFQNAGPRFSIGVGVGVVH